MTNKRAARPPITGVEMRGWELEAEDTWEGSVSMTNVGRMCAAIRAAERMAQACEAVVNTPLFHKAQHELETLEAAKSLTWRERAFLECYRAVAHYRQHVATLADERDREEG